VQVERAELVISPTQLQPAPRHVSEGLAPLAIVDTEREAHPTVGRPLLQQLHVPGWGDN
jgi:hypothetical protein